MMILTFDSLTKQAVFPFLVHNDNILVELQGHGARLRKSEQPISCLLHVCFRNSFGSFCWLPLEAHQFAVPTVPMNEIQTMSNRQQTRGKTTPHLNSVTLEVGDPDEIRLMEERVERDRKTRSSVRRIFRRHSEARDTDSNPNGDLTFESDGTEESTRETFWSE
eukprot:IDg19611t1